MAETPVLETLQAQLATLRDQGAARFAPARFRYLEAQSERLETLPRRSRQPLIRLAAALASFEDAFQAADAQVEDALGEAPLPDTLARLRKEGDLKALLRHLRARERHATASPFAPLQDCYSRPATPEDEANDRDPVLALLREQEQRVLARHGIDAPAAPATDNRPRELKALRQVRAKQQHQRKRQRIDQAIQQTPSEAGPLNSHRLVSRALATLRDLSPAYLDHLVTQVDTLMWLEKRAKSRRNSS